MSRNGIGMQDESVMEVLGSVPGAIRELTEKVKSYAKENSELKQKLAAYQRREQAEEIIELMDSSGIGASDKSFQEKVASLLSSGEDLPVVLKAVQLQSNSEYDFFSADGGGEDDGETLETYLLGRVGH
jgi:hypothetical protein